MTKIESQSSTGRSVVHMAIIGKTRRIEVTTLVSLAFLVGASGCGEPATFHVVPVESQDATEKGIQIPPGTVSSTVPHNESTPKAGNADVSPTSDATPATETKPQLSKQKLSKQKLSKQTAPEPEGEKANVPLEIAGAFLTCWTDIPTGTSGVVTADAGQARVGCGFIDHKGTKMNQMISMDRWQISSSSNASRYDAISGIQVSKSPYWSVEFALPRGDIVSRRVKVEVPAGTFGNPTDVDVYTSLASAKKVAGQENPNYFHLGGGRGSGLGGCPNETAIRRQSAAFSEKIPFSFRAPPIGDKLGRLVIRISGLCGLTFNSYLYAPQIIIVRKSSPEVAVVSTQMTSTDQTVEARLESGQYEFLLSSATVVADDPEDVGVRGIFAIPILGDAAFQAMEAVPWTK